MTTCKGCWLAGCTWARKGQKWRLYEPNGDRHRCAAYRRPEPKREPAHEAGPAIVGKAYIQSCGKCDVPPFESCACSALLDSRSAAERVNSEADERFNHLLDLLSV